MRVASARSSGRSSVTSDRRVSTTTEAPSAAGRRRSTAATPKQVLVPVVQDPALRPRQERGEPAAHRTGAAGEVVDHQSAPIAGRRGREAFDELAGARRGVGRLAEVEPSKR